MKPMPSSLNEMMVEASSLGLLPTSQKDLKVTPRIKLLEYAYNSYKAGRSFNRTSMIVMGTTGSGKSSIVNHLLGVDLAKIAKSKSETRMTSEFVLTAEDPQLDVSDLSLGIIDTPGCDDTDGPAQDACNLMSVLNFCKSSPWLKDGVPNIVLLIIPTNDVRFSGENSRFHNVLKNIAHLKIVDTQRPNLVVAFTWACSIPYKNEVKWKQAMEGKSLEISRIVRETLMVNAPIVWIENEYEDYELPKSEDHQQSRLPDDTWQPKNLFVAISKLLIENKDNLGLMAFKRFFTLSLEQKKRVKMGHFVKAKIAKNEQLSWKETKIMNSLRREAMVGSQLPQVTSMINEYLERRASTILQVQSNEAQQISTDLVEKHGLLTLEDIREHNIGSLNALMGKKLPPFAVQMLNEVFGLQANSSTPPVFMFVGSGYNILNDEMKPVAIFNLDQDALPVDFGIKLPRGLILRAVPESENYMDHFESEGEYVRHRLKQVNINTQMDLTLFNMNSRAGSSWGSTNQGSLSTFEHSFLYEKRLFRVDVSDPSALSLIENFQNAVRSIRLPHAYEKTERGNRADYEDFFNTWGHFVVTSAYGGGAVEVKRKTIGSGNLDSTVTEVRAELEAMFRNITGGFNAHYVNKAEANTFSNLSTCTMKWSGGNSNHHVMSVAEATPEKWKKWESSLATHPAFLTTKLSLTPIYEMVGLVEPTKVSGCRDALQDLLGGKFKIYLNKEEERQKKMEAEERRQQEVEETNRKKIADQAKPSESPSCFPGTSMVLVRGLDRPKAMKDLKIGDKVLTFVGSKFVFSPVFMFAHADHTRPVSYLEIHTSLGIHISISPKHLILVNSDREVKFADQVRVGDIVLHAAKNVSDDGFNLVETKVEKIVRIIKEGLYAPFTLSGNIVVDGVLASCYANVSGFGNLISAQTLAHCCVLPFRALHHLGYDHQILRIQNGKEMPTAVEGLIGLFKGFVIF